MKRVVQVVTGDTKVCAESRLIIVHQHRRHRHHRVAVKISAARAQPGDKVILSGYIGDHGTNHHDCARRLELETDIESDCAPLNSR